MSWYDDLLQRIGTLQRQVNALPTAITYANRLALDDDVRFDTLADGDVPTWDASTKKFVNAAGTGTNYWEYGVTGAHVLDLNPTSTSGIDILSAIIAEGMIGLTASQSSDHSRESITFGKFGPLNPASPGGHFDATFDLLSEQTTSNQIGEVFLFARSATEGGVIIDAVGDGANPGEGFILADGDTNQSIVELLATAPSSHSASVHVYAKPSVPVGVVHLTADQVAFTNCNAAPNTGTGWPYEFANGSFALWFDSSTKVLTAVGKDSGGTVRTLAIGTLT